MCNNSTKLMSNLINECIKKVNGKIKINIENKVDKRVYDKINQ